MMNIRLKFPKANITLISIFLLFSSMLFVLPVSANWYSYYSQSGYYGLWAVIYTPKNIPYTPNGDNQSHSVTTPGGGPWVQTGWLYYPNWSQAKQYYEYGVGGDHEIIYLNNHVWGTGCKYEVSQDGDIGLNRWCVWVNGVKIRCWNNIHAAPSLLIAQSETHFNPETVFFTSFKAIRVRNAAGTWVYPTLSNHMTADPPYRYSILTSTSFQTWRIGIFLPLMIK